MFIYHKHVFYRKVFKKNFIPSLCTELPINSTKTTDILPQTQICYKPILVLEPDVQDL